MPTALLNGIDVYYERAGAGKRLLFLNGSGSSLAHTSVFVDVFRARMDVVAHDQRGLGETAKPPGPYDMAQYAADALALLDHVGWESCRMVGVSSSGMVAQELAVTAPRRVERLALVLPTSPGGGPVLLPAPRAGPIARGRARRHVDPSPRHPLRRGVAGPHTPGTSAWSTCWPSAAAEKSEEVQRGEAEHLQARRHHDVWSRLDRVTAPTLIAAGRYDGIAPLENAEAMVKAIPGSELRVYEGGHCFFAQDAAALPDILAFLDN